MQISQRIIDYAIWYYLKYYPSPKKLEQKLNDKFGPNSVNGEKYGGITKEEIDYILKEKLKNIIQEEEVIQSKIRSYKNKAKSQLYIKQKLYSRLENRELLEKYLEEAFVDGEFDLVKAEYEKLLIKFRYDINNMAYEEKSKITQKLLAKGFRYDDIRKIVI